MTAVEFEKIVDARITKIRDLVVRKGAEYARGDRLILLEALVKERRL